MSFEDLLPSLEQLSVSIITSSLCSQPFHYFVVAKSMKTLHFYVVVVQSPDSSYIIISIALKIRITFSLLTVWHKTLHTDYR